MGNKYITEYEDYLNERNDLNWLEGIGFSYQDIVIIENMFIVL